MGKRGPPKTPLALLQSRGSWLANERSECEMPEGLPSAPDWLTEGARAHWFRLIPLLSTAGILRQTDGNSLARYCMQLDRWIECEKFIQDHGMVLETEKGLVNYPHVATSLRLSELLTKAEDRFGLNPSSRSSVGGADKKENVNGKSRFFA
jgi:P27 family predicted phage terminase small subunit